MTFGSLAESTIGYIACMFPYAWHVLYRWTGKPVVLLWEFRFARIVFIFKFRIAFLFVICGVIVNLICCFISGLYWIPIAWTTLLLSMSVHFVVTNTHIAWRQLCFVVLDTARCFVQDITYTLHYVCTIWFQNAFYLNAKLLQNKLRQEIDAHQTTMVALDASRLPKGVNMLITDFVFDAAIQQLSTETAIYDVLKGHVPELVMRKIIEYALDATADSKVEFTVCFVTFVLSQI